MNRRGFTLIELTVALAVAAMLFAAVVLGIRSLTGARAKEATNELAAVVVSLYDTAALTGRTCRLVFDLPGPKDDTSEVKYRAECAKGQLTARKDRDNELREAANDKKEAASRPKQDKRFQQLNSSNTPTVQELMEREKQRVDDNFKYSGFTSDEIPERTLPAQVRVTVWTSHQRETVTSGLAYIYFFPQGFTEKSQVVVKQSGNAWTLKVSPLTGKVSTVADELETPRS